MKKNTKKLLTAVGVVGATATVASFSAFATTRFLSRVALDRQEPEHFQIAHGAISGKKNNAAYVQARQQCAQRMMERESETVQITAWDGVKLIGHWFPQEKAQRVIIAMHGWRSSWTKDFALISEFLEKSGCSVLYVEQRGQGSSGGAYMGFGPVERYDCLNWIQWVCLRCGGEVPVYLAGVSMGASAVLMATGLELPENVHGVIADCGFTSPMAIWKHVAQDNLHLSFRLGSRIAGSMYEKKTNADAANCSTLEALQKSKVPVLLIHGTDDHFVPVQMTYENYKACASPKKLLIVPGADHAMSYYVEPQSYEQALTDFWQQYDGQM